MPTMPADFVGHDLAALGAGDLDLVCRSSLVPTGSPVIASEGSRAVPQLANAASNWPAL
jgi:hypothetical protein